MKFKLTRHKVPLTVANEIKQRGCKPLMMTAHGADEVVILWEVEEEPEGTDLIKRGLRLVEEQQAS